jgi:hypothetical protein
MKDRCHYPPSISYPNYGGIGIKVCDKWIHSFENFLADVGVRPSIKHTLDRYPDQNGNYEPGNVRWATAREQCRNRRNNAFVTMMDGSVVTIVEASEITGISAPVLYDRNKKGRTGESLFAEVQSRKPRASL